MKSLQIFKSIEIMTNNINSAIALLLPNRLIANRQFDLLNTILESPTIPSIIGEIIKVSAFRLCT
jgi:hypothetical protein